MNLDLIPNGTIKRVHVSQNDVGRTLTFELFNNSTSYEVPSGATVKIQGTKPSGFGFSETCTVNGNVATVDTTEAMTDESGNIQTELSISYDDVVIGTSNFVLAVEKNPHPSNTTDGTQITAQSLQVQINELADIIESGGSGLTDGAKQALLNCFAHVAWIDEHGQDYYDALEDALYPPATLVSISCVYTQSGTVYDTDSLDDLKTDLVVTAHYDNGTTQTVNDYTLSGTLTTGTSTITVAYSGKTTTFDVTVTHATQQFTITNTLTNVTNSNTATVINEDATYSATLTVGTNYEMSSVSVTMGNIDVTASVYDSTTNTISIASVDGDIVIVAVAVRVYTLVQDGLLFNFDFRNKSLEQYNLSGWGNVYKITDSLNNGLLFKTATETADEYGLTANWRGLRDVSSERNNLTFGTSYTIQCLYHNTAQPSLLGWGSNTTNASRVMFAPKYVNTSATETQLTQTQYNFAKVSNGYLVVTYAVSGNTLKIYYGDTLLATFDGSEIEDFSKWVDYGIPNAVYNTGVTTMFVGYNRALTDSEILANWDYFDYVVG